MTALATTSLRPFPTGGWNQMVYEAAIVSAGAHRGGIGRVIVEADAPSLAASIDSPADAADGWYSLPFAAASAVSIVKGRTGGSVSAAEVMPLVEVRERDRQGARVSIDPVDAGTATGSAEITIPLGHPLRPVGLADLSASWGIERADTKELLTRIAEWFTETTPTGIGGNDGEGFVAVTDSALRALRNQGRALL